MEFKLSEGVTRDICKEIISQIPYESTLKSLRLSRDKKVKD